MKKNEPDTVYEKKIMGKKQLLPEGVAYARDVLKKRWPEWEEKALALAPGDLPLVNACARYARDVIHGPWPEAEKVLLDEFTARPLPKTKDLLTNARVGVIGAYIWVYSRGAMQGRWRAWEAIALALITQDDELLYSCVDYARWVIRGRWPELEPLLLEAFVNGPVFVGDPRDAFPSVNRIYCVNYLDKVVKGIWPELEELVVGPSAYLGDGVVYARCTLKTSWPALETQLLATDRMEPLNLQLEQIVIYAQYVVGSRWPEAEDFILHYLRTDPHDVVVQQAMQYADYVVHGRWQELESLLTGHPEWMLSYANEALKGRLPDSLHQEMVVRSYDPKQNPAIKKYLNRYGV